MTSGLSQVIEKVETTLGIPEPGELQDEAFSKDEKNEVITMEPKADETDKNPEGRDNSAGMKSVYSTYIAKHCFHSVDTCLEIYFIHCGVFSLILFVVIEKSKCSIVV